MCALLSPFHLIWAGHFSKHFKNVCTKYLILQMNIFCSLFCQKEAIGKKHSLDVWHVAKNIGKKLAKVRML